MSNISTVELIGCCSSLLYSLVHRIEVVGELNHKSEVVEILVNTLLVDALHSLTEDVVDPPAHFIGQPADCVCSVQHLILTLGTGVDCEQHSKDQ